MSTSDLSALLFINQKETRVVFYRKTNRGSLTLVQSMVDFHEQIGPFNLHEGKESFVPESMEQFNASLTVHKFLPDLRRNRDPLKLGPKKI